MENLFIYIAKASGLITLFSLAYFLFLKKETFFTSIRVFLIAGIITSFVLPLITITKTVWTDPVTKPQILPGTTPIQFISSPVVERSFEINWWYVTVTLYLLGIIFFLLRFITDLYKVSVLLKKQSIKREGQYKLIDTTENTSPFSFFRYIVFNSSLLTYNELTAIITHEKVHSRQLHSLDMIVSQLACALLWFNPVSWLYKKQVAQNLEFIADAEATKIISDTKAYQKTLLKILLEPQCIAITNHFYQSLIKKRIMMLNKKQSKRLNFIKLALIVPALAGFIYFFQTEVIAQERAAIIEETAEVIPAEEIAYGSEVAYPLTATTRIDKNLTDEVIRERIKMYKDIFDAKVIFKNLTRNKEGEITGLTLMVKDKNHIKSYPVYEIKSDAGDTTPINAFTLTIEKKSNESENIISFGETEEGKTSNAGTPESIKSKPESAGEYINKRMTGRDVVVIINGVVQKSKYIETPPGERFETIIELDAKSTLKKYNIKTKDGSIVLTTKKIEKPVSTALEINENRINVMTNTNVNTTINTSITENVNQIKSNPSRIVTVTTLQDAEGNMITSDGEKNVYFLINSTTTDIQLDSFKEDLEKAGIKTEYSDIKRNSIGRIISIKIKLNEKDTNSKASGSWDIKKSNEAIPDIYIGKIKGKLTVSSAK